MFLKEIGCIIVLLLGQFCWAQDNKWRLIQQLQYKNIGAWDVTPIGQLIFSSSTKIYLADTNFNIIASQSDIAFGSIKKIDAGHSLKTMIFSENQQMIGFLDNQLTFADGKKDLMDLDIDFGTLVSYSDRSDRFWVYDESNARLILFEGLSSTKKSSEITNLFEITGEEIPFSLQEKEHQLFLFYRESGVFVFDYYGSLIRRYDFPESSQVIATTNSLYGLEKDKIIKVNRETGERHEIPLPISKVYDFRIQGKYIYLKNREAIWKYSLSDKMAK